MKIKFFFFPLLFSLSSFSILAADSNAQSVSEESFVLSSGQKAPKSSDNREGLKPQKEITPSSVCILGPSGLSYFDKLPPRFRDSFFTGQERLVKAPEGVKNAVCPTGECGVVFMKYLHTRRSWMEKILKAHQKRENPDSSDDRSKPMSPPLRESER